MWNLVSSKDQCKTKMAMEFCKTNEPITIKTLSQLTNSSTRSVKNYLEELKEVMSEIGGEYISSSEGVNFKIPISIGFDYFQKRVFKKSLGFVLLEKIFFDENLTSSHLEKDLFISSSTLSRVTNTIREGLKPYGVSLETNPFRITGEELLVRHFYTKYFVEAYAVNEWPFVTIDKEFVDDLLLSTTEYYDSTPKVMSYPSFRFQFAVGLIRSLQGYSIKNDILKNEGLSITYDKLTSEIENELIDSNNHSIKEKDLYINELANTQLFKSKQVLKNRLANDHQLKNRFSEIKKFINQLSRDFNLPKENQTNLIMEIDNGISFFVIHSSDIQPKPYILYPPRDYSLINIFKRKYSMFYNIARHYIYLLCDNRGFKPTEETLEHLLYLLISNWNNLTKHLFNRYNRINIKVYSHISLQHAESIADSLISDLPQAVKVSVIEESILNEEILSAYDFDLLISTETLMLNIEQPIIYMYKSRHSYQYDYLHKLIKKIALKKEQQAGVKGNLKM